MALIDTPLRKKITELLQKVNINKYIDFLGVTDTHIENKALHFKEEDIDHVKIQKIGNNTHAQIDTHIASTNKHIDWTNASKNFKTSGIGLFAGGSILLTQSGRIWAFAGTNDTLVLNGKGTGAVWINLDGGTGGCQFGNGAGGLTGTRIYSTGNMDINGDLDVVGDFTAGTIQAGDGYTGSWVNNEGKTVTVVGGITKSVV